MNHLLHYIAVGIMLIVMSARAATAQTFREIASVPTVDSLAKFEAIPSDLLFEMLGVSGGNIQIQQPGTVSDFLASLNSAVDTKGKLLNNIAVTIAPYQMWQGSALKLEDYANGWWTRFASNIQISFGSILSASESSPTRWGIGTRFVLLNSGDARLDTNNIKALRKKVNEVFNALPFPNVGAPINANDAMAFNDIDRMTTRLRNFDINSVPDSVAIRQTGKDALNKLDGLGSNVDATLISGRRKYIESLMAGIDSVIATAKALDSARKGAKDEDPTWNATSLDANLGMVFNSADGLLSGSRISKLQGWLNGGVGFGPFQLLGQIGVRSEWDQEDSLIFTGAVMIRGGNKNLRLGLGGNPRFVLDAGDDQSARITSSFVAEFRVNSKAWIVASINLEAADNMHPVWTPGLAIKTTKGAFGW